MFKLQDSPELFRQIPELVQNEREVDHCEVTQCARLQFCSRLRQFFFRVQAQSPILNWKPFEHVMVTLGNFKKNLGVDLAAITSNGEQEAEHAKNKRPQRAVANEGINRQIMIPSARICQFAQRTDWRGVSLHGNSGS